MKYFYLDADMPGDISPSIAEWSRHPPVIHALHYEFDFYSSDVLIECPPCRIVTESARTAIEFARLTGANFDKVEVSNSHEFRGLHPEQKLPQFAWLKVDGEAGHDDFGVARNTRLVVSERALELLQSLGIPNAEVTNFEE